MGIVLLKKQVGGRGQSASMPSVWVMPALVRLVVEDCTMLQTMASHDYPAFRDLMC